jgi:hypothetical protein
MQAGWITWSDIGLQPEDATSYFHQLRPGEWSFALVRRQASSWVNEQRFETEGPNDLVLNQLRWLRDVHCLDLVDREKIIARIASLQVLPDRRPVHASINRPQDVSGLFFTPGWPALQDTYHSLAILEILSALDRIDRDACIDALLRLHLGAGDFASPSPGGYNEYKIDGTARDTFAAYESLRILGALDRIGDWGAWRFRAKDSQPSKAAQAVGTRILTLDEVEARLCQQRLNRILHERETRSQAPMRSLLEP